MPKLTVVGPRPPEPAITINGVELTPGQAMVVRTAVGDFLEFLREEPGALGPLHDGYRVLAAEVVSLLHSHG